MFIVDNILLSPMKGFMWIVRELQNAAQQEIKGEGEMLTHRLSTLYMMLETNQVTQDEFDEQEQEILARLDEIEAAGDSGSAVAEEADDEDDEDDAADTDAVDVYTDEQDDDDNDDDDDQDDDDPDGDSEAEMAADVASVNDDDEAIAPSAGLTPPDASADNSGTSPAQRS